MQINFANALLRSADAGRESHFQAANGRQFIDENFLLHTATSQRLYHDYAKQLPLIDYHNHLSPQFIAEDRQFENLTQAWLAGDHYKWRAMRANGVDESYCTGDKSDWEKFQKWAETVPYTLRNPLYHWTHLELQRYFGIHDVLHPGNARGIYDHCNALLQRPDFSVRNLLRKMNVQLICTTDDPADSLQYHRKLKEDGFEITVLPTFRPDQAMNVCDPAIFNQYLVRLAVATGTMISSYDDYVSALHSRHDFFETMGCQLSDHGLELMEAEEFTKQELEGIFQQLAAGRTIEIRDQRKFRSGLLLQFAEWNWEKGWVQQFHLGAMRNNNTRMMQTLGPDTGWDSIGDFSQARPLSRFLDKLDMRNRLAKTVLYNLNPADNEVFATMIGNFNDGSSAGKIQWGSAWWFLDQQEGMKRQLNTLSHMGLLSKFIGMLTDSRSFLSFPRHEYFRRILCDLFGKEIEQGELPADLDWIGKVIGDICYYNNLEYFNWKKINHRGK